MKPFASRILALSVLAASIVSFAEDNVQYWFDAQVEAHLTDKIKFKGEEELWYDDDRFFLQETIFLLEADVYDWLAVGVGEIHDSLPFLPFTSRTPRLRRMEPHPCPRPRNQVRILTSPL